MRSNPFNLIGRVGVVSRTGSGRGQAIAVGLAQAGAAWSSTAM